MINKEQIKKAITKAFAKGMAFILLAGIVLNGNPAGRDMENISCHEYASEKYDTVSVYAADSLSNGQELVSKAASKKSSALSKAQKKAEKKLLKAYNGLVSQLPYSKTNYLKLTDIMNEGVEKIYAVKKKADAGKTAKKYIKSLKNVDNMLTETGKEICVGFNGTIGWKSVKGAVKYRVD